MNREGASSDSREVDQYSLIHNRTGISPYGWRVRRSSFFKTYANFTQEVQDLPNSTLAINTIASGPWVEQFGGITQVGLYLNTGPDEKSRLKITDIVASGVYRRNPNVLLSAETSDVGTIVIGAAQNLQDLDYGAPEDFQASPAFLFDTNVIVTAVEPIDALSFANQLLARISSLEVRLNQFRRLVTGWDGEDAVPIAPGVISRAEEIVRRLFEQSLSHLVVPSAILGPLPDGTVRFELTHADKELFLTVSEKEIEVQTWHPLETVASKGFWRIDLANLGDHIEWLLG